MPRKRQKSQKATHRRVLRETAKARLLKRLSKGK